MCVIMMTNNRVRPTEDMVARAWKQNPDGGGIAWWERDADGKIEVCWKKGVMELAEMQELCKQTPLPYICHFRVASVGGVNTYLTHPFLVTPGSELELEGRTKHAVLFHNGHWSPWNEKAIDATIHWKAQVPKGPLWSDSRAIAWMTYHCGNDFMNLLSGQKGILMNTKKFQVYPGPGWVEIQDVWCSNDYFMFGRKVSAGYTGGSGSDYNFQPRTCIRLKCTNKARSGKDVCFACEKADETVVDAALPVAQPRTTGPVGKLVRAAATQIPLDRVFTPEEVETLQKQGIASKNQLKKYQKHYPTRTKPGGKGERAQRILVELNLELAARVAARETGSTH